MYYELQIRHASEPKLKRTGLKFGTITYAVYFSKGYIRGINDAGKDGRYSGYITDDQNFPLYRIDSRGIATFIGRTDT